MNILSIFMHIHQAPLIFVSAELSCIDFLLEASTEKKFAKHSSEEQSSIRNYLSSSSVYT